MASSLLQVYLATMAKDYMVMAVFGLLALMSFLSWALFFYKLIQFNSVLKREEAFYTMIENNVLSKAIFGRRLLGGDGPFDIMLGFLSEGERPLKSVVEAASNLARSRLERGLGLIATVGSTAPFVGLFGTVWGIMKAFHMIGLQQEASLAVVAPGISEALVNTALGLFVAIPAVFFYNFLSRRLDSILDRFSAYGSVFLERLERENEEKGSDS